MRSDPVFNTKFNAELPSLDDMMQVEPEEAAKMKGFLGMEAPSTVGGEEMKEGE